LEFYDDNGNFIHSELYDYNPLHNDMIYESSYEKYPNLNDRIDVGQEVNQVNAAMYTRWVYNPWLHHPEIGFVTQRWYNQVLMGFNEY